MTGFDFTVEFTRLLASTPDASWIATGGWAGLFACSAPFRFLVCPLFRT